MIRVAVIGCGIFAIIASARYREPTHGPSVVTIRVVSPSDSASDLRTTQGTGA